MILEMDINFPFIDRATGGNGYAKRSGGYYKFMKDGVKRRCIKHVQMAMQRTYIGDKVEGIFIERIFVFTRKGSRDYDNFEAGTKYYTDSLALAGLIRNDNCNRLAWGKTKFCIGESEAIIYRCKLYETQAEFLAENPVYERIEDVEGKE